MTSRIQPPIVTLNKVYGNLCLIFVFILVLNNSELSESLNKHNKTSSALRAPSSNIRVRHPQVNSNYKLNKQQKQHQHHHQQQRLMNNDEYEKLSQSEEKAINDNSIEEQTKSVVVPSRETNGNSQVVFVNFSRVVSDGGKNESTRQVDNNEQLIKQESQIACGETNRNGKPSINNLTSDPIQNRIVGGTKADPGEFPFQVRLNIRSRRGSSLCGGVIIDQRHILTAAHCMTTCLLRDKHQRFARGNFLCLFEAKPLFRNVLLCKNPPKLTIEKHFFPSSPSYTISSSYFVSTSSIDPKSIQATIGDLRITVPDGEQVIGIEKVTPHQKYSACSYAHNNYDLALLKTNKPMTWLFTKDGYGSINRICLPHPYSEYQAGENVTVTGWGVMSEGEGSISNVLNAVDVPIVSNRECKVAYGQRVNQDHVCAGLKQGGRDSCQGDSGGPLFRRRGGQCELVGIVSFGYGCAQANTPGVYTKVSHYIDWIEKNL